MQPTEETLGLESILLQVHITPRCLD